jgi:predicted alpha/beta superfamily hydrolase
MIRTVLFALASLCLTACATVPPAPPVTPLDHLPALKGDYFRIDSREIGRPFHIYVRLPQGYARAPARAYPIVYLLDGDSLFPLLAATHLFLTIDDNLPEAIVVGIAYGTFGEGNRRATDFTPPAPGVDPASAGAPAFQRFLENELLPRIERSYRADPARRILFGQSAGGRFVIWSAFTDPDLFWARIASNPSFGPARDLFYRAPAAGTRSDLRLFVSSGSRDSPPLRAQALEWFRAWETRSVAPWLLRMFTLEGGTHAADSPRVYRAAMRWLFGQPDG